MTFLHFKPLKWAYQRIKNRDIFDQSVSLTFRGKASRTSFLGGVATIVMILLLGVLGFVLFKRMFGMTDISWNRNTQILNINESEERFTVSNEDEIVVLVETKFMGIIGSTDPERDALPNVD